MAGQPGGAIGGRFAAWQPARRSLLMLTVAAVVLLSGAGLATVLIARSQGAAVIATDTASHLHVMVVDPAGGPS